MWVCMIFVVSLLITMYSLPLGGLCFSYFMLTRLLKSTLLVDWALFFIILFIGITCFDSSILIGWFKLVLNYYTEFKMANLIKFEIFNWQIMTYQGGICLSLLLPLGIRIISLMFISKKIVPIDSSDHVNGTVLNNINQPPVVISDTELNQHCLVVGTTGVGKTTTMLNFVNSMAYRGIPVIYLDGKGSFDLVEQIRNIAKSHNRVFKVFTLRHFLNLTDLAGYNPFASGCATEWKNRIMSLFTQATSRGQEHFSLGEQNYINFVANILYKWGKPIDLRIFLALLEQPHELLNLAQKVDVGIAMKLAKLHNDRNVSQLVGDVIRVLELFVYSDYGHLFDTACLDNVIKIRQSILNNEIILFLFDASTYPEDTKKIAKMVINDINSSFAQFGKWVKCLCVFDEFASYASENLADTISLHRSNGMHAIVGTQSLVTVKLKDDSAKRIAEELIACCSTFIIHRVNHVDDAQILSQVIGTQQRYEVIYRTDNNCAKNDAFKQIEAFKVSPQTLKELKIGQAVVYRKVKGSYPQIVGIRKCCL